MNSRKIRTLNEAVALRGALEKAGARLVFTNGCFDLLHAGHVRYLAAARALGDALVVGINDDASVRALKGPERPIHPVDDRAEVLRALECVDGVVPFEGERCTALIEAIRPHVYAKGGDYTPESLDPGERAALEAAGSEIVILPLVPGRSTTAALQKLRRHSDVGATGSAASRSRRLRLAVLGSGHGSNFDSLCRAIADGSLAAEIALVISDRRDSRILGRAAEEGIDAVFVDFAAESESGSEIERAQWEIRQRLQAADVDLVILAGFMRILTATVLDAFPDRILNIHPSLLPKFRGLAAWRQALEAGESESGCSVHLVAEEVDAGTILAQSRVPVLDADTPQSLHARIQEAEHRLLPSVIREYAERLGLGAEPSERNRGG